MKILVLFNTDPVHPAVTGAAFRLLDILTGWQKSARPKITFVDNKLLLEGRFFEEAQKRKLIINYRLYSFVSWLPYHFRLTYAMIAAVLVALRLKTKPDWIYADFVPATFLPALVIGKITGTRVCLVCNLLNMRNSSFRERIYREFARFADLVVVSNPLYRSRLPNSKTFFGASMISKKFHKIPGTKKVYDLVFDGSVNNDRKGISIFIKVATRLNKRAVIITSTKELDFLEKLLAQAKRSLFTIKQNINHEEVNLVLNQSRVFLFPTRTESYGLVIGQALKVGLIVVVSDLPELHFWKDLVLFSTDFGKDTAGVLAHYQRYLEKFATKIKTSPLLNLTPVSVARKEMALLEKYI